MSNRNAGAMGRQGSRFFGSIFKSEASPASGEAKGIGLQEQQGSDGGQAPPSWTLNPRRRPVRCRSAIA